MNKENILVLDFRPLCLALFVFLSSQNGQNPYQESAVSLPPCRASLWSSCVVLPLLALTWMSAVLAITDRRSALFQILFAVFDSLEGFVIVMVHCILRREVRSATSCQSQRSSKLTRFVSQAYFILLETKPTKMSK